MILVQKKTDTHHFFEASILRARQIATLKSEFYETTGVTFFLLVTLSIQKQFSFGNAHRKHIIHSPGNA
jgi:hypothetical protein